MPTPNKFIMLAPHTFTATTGTGPVTLKPGDVIKQSDFGVDAFTDLWNELSAAKSAADYDAPGPALIAAHNAVAEIRARAGDVEEGVTMGIMLRAMIP